MYDTDTPLKAPSLSFERLPEFIESLGSHTARRVPRHELQLPYSNCYWNVARVVAERGGKLRLGWLISLWPGAYLDAMHHGVWEAPDGELWDVTADPGPKASDHIVFAPDERFKVNLQRPPNIRSRHLLLSRHKRVKAAVDAYLAKHAIEDQVAKLQYDAGYRCEDQFRVAAGEQPRREFECDEKFHKALLELKAKHGKAMQVLGDANRSLAALKL